MSIYIAAYDITDDLRRARVARRLLHYGHRVQKSVFEVWLEPEEIEELRRDVGLLLHTDDLFHLFPVDDRGPRKSIAWRQTLDGFEPVIDL